ncbi:beta-N-acetylglucosaminidase 2 precursor [Bombyx mori]|uniref:Beta-hexosaminidase n=1 Tax=Bombyx mori TaxID=7091 RepID=A4PHN7_BOMMO|nr:beta-N-acetylglucosaminidase 2 precursor [Bombyx mori]BAF52532.1 beta-N-acetylglucosaminidase 2 [Bombyx mori]
MFRLFLYLNILGAFLVTGLHIVEPGPEYPASKGAIWPRPQMQSIEIPYYKFDSDVLEIKVMDHDCPILSNAVQRSLAVLRDMLRIASPYVNRNAPQQVLDDDTYDGPLKSLSIYLTSPCEEYPHFGMIESYNLTIAADSTLRSSSIWGILRGLESWTHLFHLSDNRDQLHINKGEVHDFPRYPHRGLLVDTSRHYISMSNILLILDAMAMNKMNVFHWHIVDDQSFPYQSERFPDLSRLGAYHETLIYTKKDIQTVIDYARNRGIRVIPEFDVPGHTRSWGVAKPELLTHCYNEYAVDVGLGPMNPIKDSTYTFLRELFHEVQALFPDRYIHIGGDEVDLDCWESNPEFKRYIQEHNLTSVADFHALFMRNTIPLLSENSRPIVWQEVFDEGVPLPKDTIVQVWKGNEVYEMLNILRASHQLIYSSGWYLDHLKTGGDWTEFFNKDPRDMVSGFSKDINVDNIVGGEACMWTEVVNDMNIMSRVWPRASAVAERLWGHESQAAYQVYSRLEEHTCRMNARGIRAQPPSGPGFCLGA